jgi:hypothetical protein
VSHCLGLNTTCERGWAAELGCVQGAQTLYNCTQCLPRAGFGAAAFDPNNAFECQYTACAAGTRSVGRDCEPCGVNTFSNASEAVACEACDTLVTGLYQRESGGTACHSCLWNASVSPDACAPGSELAQSFERVTALFDLYRAHNANLSDYVTGFCDQGYACLPCEPGHYEVDRECRPCPYATYQPNFGTSECYECASGQNTSSPASTRSSDCVCDPGFE